jgi:hypothetical protein
VFFFIRQPRYETQNYTPYQRNYAQADRGPNRQDQNRRDGHYDRATHRDASPAHHSRHHGQRQVGREQHPQDNEHQPEAGYGQVSNHQEQALGYVKHSDPFPQPNANGSQGEEPEVASEEKSKAVDDSSKNIPFDEMSYEDKLTAQVRNSYTLLSVFSECVS